MAAHLHVRLDLRQDLTIGDLRAFLSLAEEAPNSSPIELVYDQDVDSDISGIIGIGTDLH